MWSHGCSGRRRARPPARLGGLTSFGAAPRSPPVPSGPSGALHTSGTGSLFGSSTRRLEARPGPYWDPVPRPQPSRPALTSHISEPTRNFARNSPTSLSNSEIRSLELQRFPTLLKLLLIELRATFPVTSPRHSPVPPTKPHEREKIRPAPLHQHPHAKKFALLASISVHTRNSSPSTAQTAQNQPIFASRANFFAVRSRIHSCWANFFALMGAAVTSHHPPTASPETDDTSASSLPHTFETADAFARTKQPNSGHFPPAKVSRVSRTPRRVPAKASPVSSDVESGLLIRSKALRRSCLLPPSHSW